MHKSNQSNTSLKDRKKIRWITPDSWCECATNRGCRVWMPSTDVFHVSCIAGQSVSVCMRELFIEPTGCLNAPQLFINNITILICPALFPHITPQPPNFYSPLLEQQDSAINFLTATVLYMLLKEEWKESKPWRQKKTRKQTITELSLFRGSV